MSWAGKHRGGLGVWTCKAREQSVQESGQQRVSSRKSREQGSSQGLGRKGCPVLNSGGGAGADPRLDFGRGLPLSAPTPSLLKGAVLGSCSWSGLKDLWLPS